MVGIVVSNRILIVAFARIFDHDGKREGKPCGASAPAPRPILNDISRHVLGLMSMALGTEAAAKQYARGPRIIGGLPRIGDCHRLSRACRVSDRDTARKRKLEEAHS